ncbi:hypothetical protein FD12_GL001396 [Lentilactobacillus rapi DSM 19907 = JCM 15042]|uniref:Uncharacterized protein n=3 Tax=Lactobacillaceae TaxID=33958 RepID=A0A512PLG6_9LACO|nr:hypothetical protein [Lentilactobacillus rapi]KRL17867.1 hypothetical protein FD12_GL001396 [Lentilactobacillus rapi DSM 19907 = JCM 15042]GEP72028.1 hypothetical protein LRA02_08960 [Lentilactobacillus rapi]
MAYVLNIYQGSADKPSFVGTDIKTAVTGLAPGTVVTAGTYQATHTDDAGIETESKRVDVPGWTVPGGNTGSSTVGKAVVGQATI